MADKRKRYQIEVDSHDIEFIMSEKRKLDQIETDSPVAKKQRKFFPMEFKLDVVERNRGVSSRQVARKYQIVEKVVRLWRRDEDKIRAAVESGSNMKRLKGGGRKNQNSEMEEKLFEWIVFMKAKDLNVTHKSLQIKALEFSRDPNFKASNGWVQGFVNRFNLSRGKQSHTKLEVCKYETGF